MFVKNDAATFEVYMSKYSQDITKKQFHQPLRAELHKQTVLRSSYMEELYCTFFLRTNMVVERTM